MRLPLRSPAVLVAVAGIVVVAVLVVIALVLPSGDGDRVPTAADQPTVPAPSALAGPPTPSVSGVPSTPPGAGLSSTAAPTSAPVDTSPKPGGPTKAAAPRPRSGFPHAGNTGLSPDTRLKAASSTVLRVQKAGTVIDRADLRADISVEADNVTIKNSRLITAGEWAIIQREGASGLVVQDSEIRGNGQDRLQHAIFNLGGDIKILRNDMSIVSDAISTNNGLIEGNYLHDPIYFDGDHTDMIQSNSGPPAGKRLVVRNNTIINTLDQTAALALFQDFGVQHDALIEGNLMAGGGYALYAGAGKLGTSYNIQVINNVFSREVYPKSGQYGPVSYWDAQGRGNVWRGNTWADTGKPVNP